MWSRCIYIELEPFAERAQLYLDATEQGSGSFLNGGSPFPQQMISSIPCFMDFASK